MSQPKVMVASGGNPTYNASGPVLSASGVDLARETSFVQTAASRAAAIKRRDGEALKIALYGDSQLGNGPDRGYGALLKNTPFLFDAVCSAGGALGCIQIDGGEAKAAEYDGSQWHNNTGALATGHTALGLTTDALIQKYIPAPIYYAKSNSSGATMICRTYMLSQWSRIYNSEQFESASGVKWRCRMFILDNGSNLPAQYRMRILYTDSGGSAQNDYTPSADFSAANRYHMGDGNYLTELVSNPVTHYNGPSDSYPSAFIFRSFSGDMNDAETYVYGCIFELLDGSDNVIESGIGFNGLYSASGRNPDVWIGDTDGRVTIGSTYTQHGSEQHIRQALWTAQNNPNHFIICFGHNSSTRSYAGSSFYGANSAFQRDHFDLMYQIAQDYYALNAAYPSFEVVIPWEANSMDSTRREEILGNINALNRLSIPAFPVDLYTVHAGDTSNYNSDGVHPNDAAAADALWTPVNTLVAQVASQLAVVPRSRLGVRTRSTVLRG